MLLDELLVRQRGPEVAVVAADQVQPFAPLLGRQQPVGGLAALAGYQPSAAVKSVARQQSLGLAYAEPQHARGLLLRQSTFQQPVHDLAAIQFSVAHGQVGGRHARDPPTFGDPTSREAATPTFPWNAYRRIAQNSVYVKISSAWVTPFMSTMGPSGKARCRRGRTASNLWARWSPCRWHTRLRWIARTNDRGSRYDTVPD